MTPSSDAPHDETVRKELKPCPFCGNKRLIPIEGADFDTYTSCLGCQSDYYCKPMEMNNAYCWKENAKLLRARDELQKENEEQARLLGMSGSIEAKLIAEKQELIGALEEISKLPWEDQGAHVDLAEDVLARVKGEK